MTKQLDTKIVLIDPRLIYASTAKDYELIDFILYTDLFI